jgi:DNA-directed RNA polymerase sigma subunit (sigma70/sigma32)
MNGRFVVLNDTYTTHEEITKEHRRKQDEQIQERRMARAYPDVARRRAKVKAAKGGFVGLVWNVFGDIDSTVRAESVDGEFLADVVNQLLDTLTPRESFVLERRYGCNGLPPMTYKALGLICPRLRDWDYEKKRNATILKFEDGILGLCSGRVQQIEHTALRKLRHPSRSQRLRKLLIIAKVITQEK